jgi:outer membrane protein assembly factor BamE (lipoprotein component of BamABCDE complex)
MGVSSREINRASPSARAARRDPAMAKNLRLAAVTLAAGLSLAACAKTVDQRGNQPTEEKLADIQPGVATKDDVARLLGTPSSIGTFDEKTWYYISKRTEQFAFLTPELVDQQVVAISFDDNGTVTDVKRHGMDDRRDVTPVARSTPAAGKELSFMEQLLGNVGKFNSNRSGVPGTTMPGQLPGGY